ncbi:MAG TPA: hypothetical protein VF525_12910 [Pyrinomonadaceae bacterium]
MSQRRDDTTEPPPGPPDERAPGSYYYDDATGYAPYDPAQDEADDDTGEHSAPTA